jgi:hypothetical protein
MLAAVGNAGTGDSPPRPGSTAPVTMETMPTSFSFLAAEDRHAAFLRIAHLRGYLVHVLVVPRE